MPALPSKLEGVWPTAQGADLSLASELTAAGGLSARTPGAGAELSLPLRSELGMLSWPLNRAE